MRNTLSELFNEIKNNEAVTYKNDFLLTWYFEKEALEKYILVAEALMALYDKNISTRCFESGLAVSQFKDKSTRTRFSYASAANLLGLAVQDLDETKSQISHGETVRETATMISFLSEFIGIRDDIFLGEGDKYQREVAHALDLAFSDGVIPQRPGIINLQSDIDHPTQSMADLMHLKQHFGSLENLRGKKIAMTWAYSPSYGKPLSVPQGIIGLMSRFGMDVQLAYPEGYELIPEITDLAAKNAKKSGGKFEICHSMDKAFENADIVYPKSWAPFEVMKKRTELLKISDIEGLDKLEQECLKQNAQFVNWECNETKMKQTKDGKALYLHCLPADISGVSCKQGEISENVFEKYRTPLYKQAGYKPYIIASMMMNYKFENIAEIIDSINNSGQKRILKTIN